VAARLSRSRGLAAAVAVGAIDLILSLTSYLLRPAGWWAWWLNAMYLALIMVAAVAGGCFALRRRGEAAADDDDGALDPTPS
jgi:membrane-bound ClpP family serine protease